METILKILSTYNYWYAPPAYQQGLLRTRYISLLKNALGNKLIKVIVGQRRVGKSYILRQLIHILINQDHIDPKNIFYLNKETYDFDRIRTTNDLASLISTYENKIKPQGKIYLFVDEVQEIENWEKLIVSYAQNPVKKYELVISGSNSKLLSAEMATLLSGRYIVTEVFPFTYNEFLEFHKLTNNKNNFINYINTSGLPETFDLQLEDNKRFYFQSLKDTILLRDILQRHKIRDYALLEDLFLFLLHHVGNMTSIPSIIKYYKSKNRKVDYLTISSYLSYMTETFIINEAPKFSLKMKEHLSGERKYYMTDLGFRNYLYPSLISEIGYSLENIVFVHLRNAGYQVSIGYGKNFEIDFYATKHDQSIYVQVAYLLASQETIEREFGALEKVTDFHSKYVVSMDDLLIKHPKGIKHQFIWDFLYNLTSFTTATK